MLGRGLEPRAPSAKKCWHGATTTGWYTIAEQHLHCSSSRPSVSTIPSTACNPTTASPANASSVRWWSDLRER